MRQRETVQQRERATEGGLVEDGGQCRLDDRAVRERRPCVAVALVSWKWQK